MTTREFCLTHASEGCAVSFGSEDDCEFVTLAGVSNEIDRLRVERDTLTAWKREALQVIEAWDRCYEALERAGHPARLGQSKADHVQQWITSLEERQL